MARRKGSGGRGGFCVPGLYERLMVGRCGHRWDDVCGLDPRHDPAFRSWRTLAEKPSDDEVALWRWVCAECEWKADQDRVARLAVGEPLVVPRRSFYGSVRREVLLPAWLRDPYSEVKWVRVHADDTIDAGG